MNSPIFIGHIEQGPIGQFDCRSTNACAHSPWQIEQIAQSISEFGFVNRFSLGRTTWSSPAHARLEAASQLHFSTVSMNRARPSFLNATPALSD
jgi:hypothetical protein